MTGISRFALTIGMLLIVAAPTLVGAAHQASPSAQTEQSGA